MSDDLNRLVGEANGKLDTLTQLVRDHIESHERRHEVIDEQLQAHAADINKAKGAKAAILAVTAAIAGVVSVAIAAAERFFR